MSKATERQWPTARPNHRSMNGWPPSRVRIGPNRLWVLPISHHGSVLAGPPYSGASRAERAMPTPNAVRNSPNDAPTASRGRRFGFGARGRAVRPVAISWRSHEAMSSPHEQPTVATPSDERNEMNDGHSEQCVRLAGV